MIVTTSFLAIALVYIKGFPFGAGIWFFVFAGFFDALFWGASLKKSLMVSRHSLLARFLALLT